MAKDGVPLALAAEEPVRRTGEKGGLNLGGSVVCLPEQTQPERIGQSTQQVHISPPPG